MECETYASFWNQKAPAGESTHGADNGANEEIMRRSSEWTARQIHAALGLDSHQRVLEYGCGTGRLGARLAPSCGEWCGVDAADELLAVAAHRLESVGNTRFEHLKSSRLDMFERRYFERAYTVSTLAHVDKVDVFLALEELSGVLKQGGLLYAETWNLMHPIGWKRWRFEVTNWRRADQSKGKNPARNRFCTPDEFELYLHEAGFKVLDLWSDSPWIQAVAGVGLGADAIEDQRNRLNVARDRIVYSREWSNLYGQILDVVYGSQAPADMLADLKAQETSDEVVLFRDYLMALWKQGEAYWGAPPEPDPT